jgi:hypothetical protein
MEHFFVKLYYIMYKNRNFIKRLPTMSAGIYTLSKPSTDLLATDVSLVVELFSFIYFSDNDIVRFRDFFNKHAREYIERPYYG